MSETTVEGTMDGTSATAIQKEQTSTTVATADAKVTTEQNADNKHLLDENGNPKTEETLTREREEKVATEAEKGEKLKEPDNLRTKVEDRAKQVEDLVVSAGVEPSEMVRFADPETGELSVAHKAKLIEKHGEAIAELIESNVQKMLVDTRKVTEAKNDAVYSQLKIEFEGVTEQSGEDTWKELSGWVKENIDVSTRKEYNQMLSAGGIQAQLAVREMVASFKKGNDLTVEAKLIEGDQDSLTPANTGYITQQEYRAELDKLISTGHDYNSSPEIMALNRKRARSMQNGR